MLEPQLASETDHDVRTFVLDLFDPRVLIRKSFIALRVPKLPEQFRQPCHVLLNITDDPGPVHATDCGSLGYGRIRFHLENATVHEEEEATWFETETRDFKLDTVQPER